MTLHISSHTSTYLSKIAPVIGGVTIIASLIDTDSSSTWSALWRIAISVSLGVFVALVGMIYHNIESRVSKLEVSSVPEGEYEMRHIDLQKNLERIEKHLEAIDFKIENLRNR